MNVTLINEEGGQVMFTLIYGVFYAITYALGAVISAPVLLLMQIIAILYNIITFPLRFF